MAEFPGKVSTRTSTPAGVPGRLRALAPDLPFLRSFLGLLMLAELVLGLLVWALIASTFYQPIPAYSWVMFVAVFFWLVTVILFVTYLLQLQTKLDMIPWPLVLVIFNAAATVLYVTAFITCSAAVQSVYQLHGDYNKRAAASFFACIVMIAYGASTFFSFQEWRGFGSNAATSQVTS
ncbi:plasmolipin [Carettochelys insculpta]|uniref:plasmolipin n=1 Tax=Carettochelys insculpta TaxID=44489 RepID=UPI003EBFC3A3